DAGGGRRAVPRVHQGAPGGLDRLLRHAARPGRIGGCHDRRAYRGNAEASGRGDGERGQSAAKLAGVLARKTAREEAGAHAPIRGEVTGQTRKIASIEFAPSWPSCSVGRAV